jgi:hypothetical protein
MLTEAVSPKMMLFKFIQIAALLFLSVIGSNADDVSKYMNVGKHG